MSASRFIGLLAILLLLIGCDSGDPGIIESDDGTRGSLLITTEIDRLTIAEIEALGFLIPTRYDVVLYQLIYRTPDVDGTLTEASGLLAVPEGFEGPLPLASYQHGTEAKRMGVASVAGTDAGETAVAVALATDGYLAVMPDYLGLGVSEGLHPYVHSASLASATLDMLRAARRFAEIDGMSLDGQVFLLGYSEGGQATAAAQRLLEAEHRAEFDLTASALMAGSYDLSGTMADVMLAREPYEAPYYLPYILLAYNQIYGLVDSLDDLFVAPYAANLPQWFDGTLGAGRINAQLPPVPLDIAQTDFLEAFESDPNHPFRLALAANDTYDWTPQAPTRIYHCQADELVPFANSTIAYNRFVERGAPDVTLVPLDFGGHAACAAPALLLAKAWFDEQR